jgi:hypothetical protein
MHVHHFLPFADSMCCPAAIDWNRSSGNRSSSAAAEEDGKRSDFFDRGESLIGLLL